MLALAVGLPPFPGGALAGIVMLAFTFGPARVPFRTWLAAMAAPVGFLLTGAATLLFSVGPHGIALAPQGATAALELLTRSFSAIICLLFLSLTTPATDLVAGLRRLGVPRDLADVAMLTYRFVFTVADAAIAMDHAQQARLGHSTGRRWIRSLGILIANLLPRTLDRARRLETGLAARGWDGEMRVLSETPRASASVLAAILALEIAVCAIGVLLR
jgi:cobalt/nickel transport system permease protein